MKTIQPYNRERAVFYAKKYAYIRDESFFDFTEFGGNCTAYVSQCLYFANKVMNPLPVLGWYYYSSFNRSASWSGVEFFYNFITSNKTLGPFGRLCKKEELELGDVVQLKFREFTSFTHTLIVTGIVGAGQNKKILVSSNTYDVYNKNLSVYVYEKARFIKIEGVYEN